MAYTRRKNQKISYKLHVDVPDGTKEEHKGFDNLQDIADAINNIYFNDFQVVSRAMVNNWLYKGNNMRREYALRFKIKRVMEQ